MSGVDRSQFKTVESIEELQKHVNRFLQVYYPAVNEYFLGYLEEVKEGEEKDINIFLKDCVYRKGEMIDTDFYTTQKKRRVYIPRVIKCKIEYTLMPTPSS